MGSMDWTWKKSLFIVAIFVAIIIMPFFLISDTMMDWYHEKIDAEPKSDNSKWMTLKTADICFDTYRYQRATKYYLKYLTNYPDDEQIPWIRFWHARSLEECLKYSEASTIFQKIRRDYPENQELNKRAKDGWYRCTYGIGH